MTSNSDQWQRWDHNQKDEYGTYNDNDNDNDDDNDNDNDDDNDNDNDNDDNDNNDSSNDDGIIIVTMQFLTIMHGSCSRKDGYGDVTLIITLIIVIIRVMMLLC